MNKTQEVLYQLAKDTPKVSGARVVACIVHKRKIIAFGFNQRRTHPMQKKFGKNSDAIYLHAEVDVIKNALRTISIDELSKSTLYIMRAKKTKSGGVWTTGLAKPCSGCQRCIETFNIHNVIYSEGE